MTLIYLASPYSHPSPAVREARFLAARAMTIFALRQGHAVFSPIVYGKDMETQLGTDHLSWKPLNDAMLEASARMWVLRLYGWEKSKGVTYEIALAEKLGKRVTYIDELESPQC